MLGNKLLPMGSNSPYGCQWHWSILALPLFSSKLHSSISWCTLTAFIKTSKIPTDSCLEPYQFSIIEQTIDASVTTFFRFLSTLSHLIKPASITVGSELQYLASTQVHSFIRSTPISTLEITLLWSSSIWINWIQSVLCLVSTFHARIKNMIVEMNTCLPKHPTLKFSILHPTNCNLPKCGSSLLSLRAIPTSQSHLRPCLHSKIQGKLFHVHPKHMPNYSRNAALHKMVESPVAQSTQHHQHVYVNLKIVWNLTFPIQNYHSANTSK